MSSVKFTRAPQSGTRDACYRQDLVLLSQRVIRTKTGPMSYSQTITVDRVGKGNYNALVQLDAEASSSARKPFESLSVYVGLAQEGDNVHVYAAGVMEVNRRVVPNLVIFDASGIAGDLAGKGTLWLSGHFTERRAAAASSARWGARRLSRLVEEARRRVGGQP